MHTMSRLLLQPRSAIFSTILRNARTVSKPSKLMLNSVSPGPISNYSKFFRAAGFCLGVSGLTYVSCSVWNYESVRKTLRSLPTKDLFPIQKFPDWRDQIHGWWCGLSDGKKLVAGIIVANCMVFLFWQFKGFQPIMSKYFLSDPTAKRLGLPVLLSMFSQIAPFHLFCNMYVLWSFSDAALHMFGKEQFLYFYTTAGLFSGLLSVLNKLTRGIPQPSLGASGAITGVLGAVCTAFPDSKLSIIFLPMYPFSADSALKALIAFESLGMLLRWRFFDHAAHLGGLLFGIWYVKYGHQITWGKRQAVVEWWHKIRG